MCLESSFGWLSLKYARKIGLWDDVGHEKMGRFKVHFSRTRIFEAL